MKYKIFLTCFLFSPLMNVFSHQISKSLIHDYQSTSDTITTILLTKEDSLKEANIKTINHIKNIFSNSPNKRPKIGLALAGGGAKGFAHEGVLQLIDSLDIPVDFIVGNSMGGLVAALYSIGYSGKDLEEYTKSLDWNSVLKDKPRREQLPFIEKKKTGMYQLSIGLKGYQLTVPSGIIYGQNVQLEFLSKTGPYEDVNDFDKLPIPFRCIAVDLVTGKEEILGSGSLSKAMRATMSIPSAFSPVDWDKYLLVDGMVLNNFPVDVVKKMGADIVIGLNLTTGRMEKENLTDFLSILNRTVDIPMGGRLEENIALSDIYISQDLDGFSTADFAPEKVSKIIERGKEAGIRNLDVLLALKEELEKYDDYLQWKNIEKGKNRKVILDKRETFVLQPYLIEKISITGNKKFESDFIRNYLEIENGELFNTAIIQKKIESLYALNYFETVTYQIIKIDDNKINLEINVKEKHVNRVVAGFKYDDYFKLVGLLGLETNSALIQGAQLEAYLKFGGLTEFDVTMLYATRSMDIPIYPFLKIEYHDIPINFYLGERKIFNFNNRSWNFSGGINFSLSKFWNLEAALNAEFMSVATDIASYDVADVVKNEHAEDKIINGKLKLLYDSLDDNIVPNSGLNFTATYEIPIKDLGAEVQFHKFSSWAEYFMPLGKKHNLKLAGSYCFASEGTPFYKWFYLGGPLTFVGIDYLQANGTEFSIGQAIYRYELFNDIYAKGIFNVMFNYNLWDNINPVRGKSIIGGGLSLMMRTMFGKAELTWSQGDVNLHDPGKKINRVYFTFGYNL